MIQSNLKKSLFIFSLFILLASGKFPWKILFFEKKKYLLHHQACHIFVLLILDVMVSFYENQWLANTLFH
jgi:tryptophan-rich sensory protein